MRNIKEEALLWVRLISFVVIWAAILYVTRNGTVDQLGSPEEASGRRDCLRHSGIRVYEVVLAYVGFPRMVSTIHGLAGNVAGRAQEHLERPEYRSESRAYSDNTRHTADLFLDQLHGIHRGVRELQHGRADHA